ncbi:DUF1801 domain-containing protein [Telluribacter sp. SYSU D00476]|uniref:DUF1801 domain-containing protein n=1 Tax=Telluribacter sp. SYSU D00476 TaxID=2811430 RepID=UPI0038F7A978
MKQQRPQYNKLTHVSIKWGVPCYTFQKGNVVLIHQFKEYCALLFVKGALYRMQGVF